MIDRCAHGSALAATLLLLGWLAGATSVHASEPADSLARYSPAKIPPRQTWERAVDLPGDVAYAPFGLLFYGVESFLSYQERTRFLQRLRDRFTWDEGRKTLIPAVDSRSGVGLAYADRQWINSLPQLQIGAVGGFRRRHGLLVVASGDRLRLGLEVRRRPDESFWGVGPVTTDGDQARYERRLVMPWLEMLMGNDSTRLAARAAVQWNDLSGGTQEDHPTVPDRFTEVQAPGQTGDPVLARFGVTLLRDSRDRKGNPYSGGLALGRVEFVRQLSAGDFDFARLSAEAVRYAEITSGRVLLARVGASAVRPLGGGTVPFYELSEIGDEATTIRGFDRGRYRDRQALFGGLEYRWPVWRVIDGVAFINAGQVGRSLVDDLDTDLLRTSWGGGVRLWRTSGVASRLLITRSDRGTLLQGFLASTF